MSEKDKKAFVLRVKPELMKEIEKWAGDEFRSTNWQIEFLLHEALKAKRKRNKIKNSED